MKLTIDYIYLSEIDGIHPQVKESAAVMSGKPFVPIAKIATLEIKVVKSFFKFPQMMIEKLKGKYYLVHGFREFELASTFFKIHRQDLKICVLVISGRRNADERTKEVIQQTFFKHAISSLAPGWTKLFGVIFRVWKEHDPVEFESLIQLKSGKKTTLSSLSKALNINPTTIL